MWVDRPEILLLETTTNIRPFRRSLMARPFQLLARFSLQLLVSEDEYRQLLEHESLDAARSERGATEKAA